jgi:hypothetical protein
MDHEVPFVKVHERIERTGLNLMQGLGDNFALPKISWSHIATTRSEMMENPALISNGTMVSWETH